ncbi:MAG TPA: cell division protein FtsZ, partial [Deltaproteobacteria bacterium]|nr:cell division protein FtsZ [Deltaproteobacteria bacterium]
MFELEKIDSKGAQLIKVVGVGGCGCNAVNNMINAKIKGVEFIACNTDIQSLRSSLSTSRIQLGVKLTKGLGAGGDPEVGKNAAIENEKDIRAAIENADMIFIAAGMGG